LIEKEYKNYPNRPILIRGKNPPKNPPYSRPRGGEKSLGGYMHEAIKLDHNGIDNHANDVLNASNNNSKNPISHNANSHNVNKANNNNIDNNNHINNNNNNKNK